MPTIEVFADVTCPFAHVGVRRWIQRRAELGRADVSLRVKAWPLELVNGEPLSAEHVGHEIEDLRAQVSPELFAGFDATRFPSTTLPALRLTSAAYATGPAVGEAVALELRDRLFERGEDVSEPEVLDAVAAAHGVGAGWQVAPSSPQDDPVRTEWEEGRRRGVAGSPHFLGPGLDLFCPSLRIRREGDHLRVSIARGTFEELSRLSFGGTPPSDGRLLRTA
jgi:predicted DsbA family dithiol-disulfide isomerase